MRWPSTPQRRLQLAEAVALVATVIAYALTVLAVDGPAVETNPAVREIVASAGWTAAGVLAVVVVHGSFAVYRRVRHTAPRVVLAGAALVVAVSVADLLVSLPVALQVELLAGAGAGEIVPIVVTMTVAAACLARCRSRSIVNRVRGGASRAKRYWPGIGRRTVRRGVVVAVLVALVLTPAIAMVPFGGDTSADPVGEARAATEFTEQFNDAGLGGWDVPGGTWSRVTSPTYEGAGAAQGATTADDGDYQIDNTFTGGSYSSFTFWYYQTRNGNHAYVAGGEDGQPGVFDITISGTTVNTGNTNGVATLSNKTWYQFALTNISYSAETYTLEITSAPGTNIATHDESFAYSGSTNISLLSLGVRDANATIDNMQGNGTVYTATATATPTATAAATATPEPESYDYTMQVCYNGDAEFRDEGATATWQQVEIDDGLLGGGGDIIHEETTLFDSTFLGGTTTTTIDDRDDVTIRTTVETDRAVFDIAGMEPNPDNTFDLFRVDVPFGTDVDSPRAIPARNPLACQDNTTETPGPGTPLPTDQLTPTPQRTGASSGPGGPAGDITALGICNVPGEDGTTKKGLLVEYWDPTYSTESIWYELTYKGVTGGDYVRFDNPKGYYYGCSAGEDGIDGPGTEPTPTPYPPLTPYPTLTPYPNGTTPTPYPPLTPYPTLTPYPNGTTPTPIQRTPYPTLTPYPNGTTPTPYPPVTPYPSPTPRPTITPYPNGSTVTPYPNGSMPTITAPPIPTIGGQACPDGEQPARDEPRLQLRAELSNGSTISRTNCGFDDEVPSNPFNLSGGGGGGGPLVSPGAGSGAPAWLVPAAGIAAVGYALWRRRQGGGSAGAGGSTGGSARGGGAP